MYWYSSLAQKGSKYMVNIGKRATNDICSIFIRSTDEGNVHLPSTVSCVMIYTLAQVNLTFYAVSNL